MAKGRASASTEAVSTQASNGETAPAEETKKEKVNLGDTASLKRALDDAAATVVISAGHREDHFVTDVKIALGAVTCAFALIAQFWPSKFPGNWWLLFFCVAAYVVCSVLLNLFVAYKEKAVFLFTQPTKGYLGQIPLQLSSRLPRHSDMYTLEISSPSPAKKGRPGKPACLEKSITNYFDEDGFLVDGPFKGDVQQLLAQFESRHKKVQ